MPSAALVRDYGQTGRGTRAGAQDLVRRKLMLEIDGQYLSLAVMRRRVQKPIARNNHDWIQIAAAQAAEPLPSAV